MPLVVDLTCRSAIKQCQIYDQLGHQEQGPRAMASKISRVEALLMLVAATGILYGR